MATAKLMSRNNSRFESLDALRGICACLVVVFHLSSTMNGYISDKGIVATFYTCVDFFFVLSGFVISVSYERKLLGGFKLRDYVLLRLGRIYPMHLLMLCAFVCLEFLKFIIPTERPPFSAPYFSVESLFYNLLLIQSIGLVDNTTWNYSSWSTSTEFWTYLLYAGALLLFRQRIWVPATIVVITAPFILMQMDKEYLGFFVSDYALIRCLLGFSVGILTYRIFENIRELKFSTTTFSFIEAVAVALCLDYIFYFGLNQYSFFVPYVFGILVLAFAFERGALSRALYWKPLIALGTLSYSIYMIHAFVLVVMINIGKIAEKITGMPLTKEVVVDGDPIDLLGATPIQGTLFQIVTFAFVIVGSVVTYRWFEKPCNDWVRRWVKAKDKVTAPAAESSAAF